ncbi:MAG TPA: serine hydrolase [Acidobacteriaceae bacterium]|nr:serine hydrolase [Acidobacteriaceae bacterium]
MLRWSVVKRSSLASATLVLCLAPALHAQNDAALAATLQQSIAPFHGKVSLWAVDKSTGKTVAIDADQPVPTASVIKLGVLYTALEQIRSGKAHFNDPLTLHHEDQVPGSGVLLFFDTPMQLTLKDALTLMIAESDNTATNLVIDHLGLKTIDDQLTALGMKNTWLYKKVFRPASGPMPPDQPQFGLGKTSAREMGELMERFVTCDLETNPIGTPAPPPASASDQALCNAALHMLKVQFFRNSIPRYLEKLDTTEGDSAVANKTGALDHVRNDVGAVYTKHGTIIISEFTHDNADTSWTPDNQAEVLMAKLAKQIIDAWTPGS